MAKSLAVLYRPTKFDDVCGQSEVKDILKNQLSTNTVKNAYLFCGAAGCGKTTCARIFANEINHHCGNPIELDAASHNGVDDVREIISQASTKSIMGEYKVFILDEVHMLSAGAWAAMLKLIEEPPAKTIFIMCTTDPQKIPKTILSRVQRYNFSKLPMNVIVDRMNAIIQMENSSSADSTIQIDVDALKYIARISDGGMRDALTSLDKCISHTEHITVASVVEALGAVEYDDMINLTDCIVLNDVSGVVSVITSIHQSGKDLKLFIRHYLEFLLDVNVLSITNSFDYVQIPNIYDTILGVKSSKWGTMGRDILNSVVKLNADIKWDSSPKSMILATFLLMMGGE